MLKRAEVTNDQMQRTHWQKKDSTDNLEELQKMVTFSEYVER